MVWHDMAIPWFGGMNGMVWWYEWYGRMVWYGNGSMNGMVW